MSAAERAMAYRNRKRGGPPRKRGRHQSAAEIMRRYRRKKAGLVLSANGSDNARVFADIAHL